MCGIAGALVNARSTVSHETLARMLKAIEHRGPDGHGAREFPAANGQRVYLGHRRLAIIDPRPEGAQPMTTADGRLWITFNGEIYNYEALRNELLAQGVVFRSHSDTEVLL